MAEEQTIANLIEDRDISVTFKEHNSTHDVVKPEYGTPFKVRRRNFTATVKTPSYGEHSFSYFMGDAAGEPEAASLLWSVAMDAQYFVYNSRVFNFEDWCDEYGYDNDSRKAERIYNECRKNAEALERVLGPRTFKDLIKLVDEGVEK